jgi:hypothetical protein
MKRSDFEDILKINKWLFFQVLRVSCILHEFILPPKFLGYLTSRLCGAPTVLTLKFTDFLKLNLKGLSRDVLMCVLEFVCVTDIC